ncbi:NAD-dependent epimerase/dehydratase family protein [Ensifer sp. PDNC004]|uniref:NAD-dependent epimerase/dehydratase family protein n=1 Tax=Ensifer sp. PDNC004 TaxID=2811423 RepID=UPI001FF020A7|nr:NAD(P)H-binding protein [Ensifer sp. PDNC004]
MPRAVIVGGTGQVGLATARRLVGEAWDVTIASRRATTLPEGCHHVEVDARDVDRLRAVVGSDTDVLLSCVAFNATDAKCLAEAGKSAGRIVAISSASVYRDHEGRTLDEAADCGFPVFAGALTEESPTVAPGPETYSTRKAAMEQTLLGRAGCPVTILRPCAIHGSEADTPANGGSSKGCWTAGPLFPWPMVAGASSRRHPWPPSPTPCFRQPMDSCRRSPMFPTPTAPPLRKSATPS